jgi:hypothetical protein
VAHFRYNVERSYKETPTPPPPRQSTPCPPSNSGCLVIFLLIGISFIAGFLS